MCSRGGLLDFENEEYAVSYLLSGQGPASSIILLFFFFFFNFIFFIFWPCHTACRILVPRPGIEPTPPAVEAQSLKHRTAREIL